MDRFSKAVGFILILGFSLSALAMDPPPAYVKHCVACHMVDGRGRASSAIGVIPDLRSKAIINLSDEDLFNSVARGSVHKAYPHAFLRLGVSEQELKDLVDYMRFLQRVPKRTASAKLVSAH